MRGIPVRIEMGPKDLEAGQAVLCAEIPERKRWCRFRRFRKKYRSFWIPCKKRCWSAPRVHMEKHTYTALTKEEFKKTADEKPGFIKAMWCGCQECEDAAKEEIGVTSRCMPFRQEILSDTCVFCGKPAKKLVYWG